MKTALVAFGGAVVGITIFTIGWWVWAWRVWSRDH